MGNKTTGPSIDKRIV